MTFADHPLLATVDGLDALTAATRLLARNPGQPKARALLLDALDEAGVDTEDDAATEPLLTHLLTETRAWRALTLAWDAAWGEETDSASVWIVRDADRAHVLTQYDFQAVGATDLPLVLPLAPAAWTAEHRDALIAAFVAYVEGEAGLGAVDFRIEASRGFAWMRAPVAAVARSAPPS